MTAWVALLLACAAPAPLPWLTADGLTDSGRRPVVGSRGLVELGAGDTVTVRVQRLVDRGVDGASWFADIEGDPGGRVGVTWTGSGAAGTARYRSRRYRIAHGALVELTEVPPHECATP